MKKQRYKLVKVSGLPKLSFAITENALDKNGQWIVRKNILYLTRLRQYQTLCDYDVFDFILCPSADLSHDLMLQSLMEESVI